MMCASVTPRAAAMPAKLTPCRLAEVLVLPPAQQVESFLAYYNDVDSRRAGAGADGLASVGEHDVYGECQQAPSLYTRFYRLVRVPGLVEAWAEAQLLCRGVGTFCAMCRPCMIGVLM